MQPAADAAPARADGAAFPREVARPTRIRVIIAEDDPDLREGLRLALEADGRCEVVGGAGDGASLLDMLMTTECDAILLDLTMPGKNGLQVLDELADRPDHPPVVVVSVHSDATHVDRALALGAVGYVLKSAPINDIVMAADQAASGGAFLQPALVKAILERHLLVSSGHGSSNIDLSKRQLEVLHGLALGLSNKEIARMLDLAPGTVNDYLKELYARLGVASRAAAVSVGIRRGLLL
jgi:DNA-binding NarL/FixJ family response regulator